MQQSLIFLLTEQLFIPIMFLVSSFVYIYCLCRLFFDKLLYTYLIRLQTELYISIISVDFFFGQVVVRLT